MTFKMRSGNGPLKFKDMGSSPAKQSLDWTKDDEVSRDEGKANLRKDTKSIRDLASKAYKATQIPGSPTYNPAQEIKKAKAKKVVDKAMSEAVERGKAKGKLKNIAKAAKKKAKDVSKVKKNRA